MTEYIADLELNDTEGAGVMGGQTRPVAAAVPTLDADHAVQTTAGKPVKPIDGSPAR